MLGLNPQSFLEMPCGFLMLFDERISYFSGIREGNKASPKERLHTGRFCVIRNKNRGSLWSVGGGDPGHMGMLSHGSTLRQTATRS